MRGLRSTIALLVVLLGLGAYIYFVASKTDESASTKDRLFPGVASDNIEELTVKNDAGEVTTLKKVDTKWQVTAPVSARGSDMESSGIANALAALDFTRVVEDNPADVKEYGLDAPATEITFKSNSGKPSGKLLIGKKTATGGSLYARKDGETRVVLIAEYNNTTFNRSTFDLRDKAVMSFDRTKVDGFDVVLADSSFELTKKESDWTMVRPITARADASAADGLVSAIESLQMKSAVGATATPEQLTQYGLDKPVSVVNLHLGAERASIAVGGPTPEPDTVYVKDVNKPDIYVVQKAAADDLQKKADDYRRHDMFDMRAFTATRLEITRNGKTTAFDKVKGTGENAQDTWKRVSPAGADPDKDKFQTFVAALADIRATEFVESRAGTGLDNPAVTIVVKFDEGKKEERVFFSKAGSDAYSARPDDPGAAKIDTTKLDDALTSIDEFTK